MVVVAAVSSVFLLQFHWFGDAASEQRGPIDTLFDVMIVLSCVVFAIVIVMFAYAIWKFRVKPGDEGDGKPIHGNTKLEIAWTVIPTVIVLFGAGYSWIVLDDIEAKSSDAMRLDVTAQQFEWSFGYPEKMIGSGRERDRGHHARAPRAGRSPARRAPDGARRPALVLGPGMGHQARRGPGARPRGRGRRQHVRRHPGPGGHVQPDLHRAVRHRALDDARHGRGREPRRTSTSGSNEQAASQSQGGAAGGSSSSGGT